MEITVIGGVYREECAWPEINQLMGSAGRAADCMSKLDSKLKVKLLAEVAEEDIDELLKQFAFYTNASIEVEQRANTPLFHYAHPMSRPEVFPVGKRRKTISHDIKSENVVLFGMIDRDVEFDCNTVVYDPQNTEFPKLFSETSGNASNLIYVLNKHELETFYSEDHDGVSKGISEMCTWLKEKESAKIVIVKCGANGAYIDYLSQEWVPCYESNSVAPVGSGDCFTASFAYFYLSQKLDPVEAADKASFATSFFVEHGTLVPQEQIREAHVTGKKLSGNQNTKKVYLAGPFFSMPEMWLVDQTKAAIEGLGMAVHSPYHELGIGPAELVAPQDLIALDECDVVFALFDNHDPGTLFEIGYAISQNKKVVIYTETSTEEHLKMYEGTGCIIEKDFATSLYKLGWI